MLLPTCSSFDAHIYRVTISLSLSLSLSLSWCLSVFEKIEGDFPCQRVLAAWEIGANEVVSLLVSVGEASPESMIAFADATSFCYCFSSTQFIV